MGPDSGSGLSHPWRSASPAGRPQMGVVASLLLLGAAVASAQPATERSETRHAELFTAAQAAMDRQEAARARDLLREALDLRPDHGPTAYFLALTLRDTGEIVEAVRLLDSLLTGSFGDVPADFRAEADGLRTELRARIASLSLRVIGPEAAEVRIDGEPRGTASNDTPLALEVDPGPHRIYASADDHDPAERAIDVDPGERLMLELTLARSEAPATEVPVADPFRKRPGFWVLMAAVVVVVAGGVALGVTLGRDDGSLDRQLPFDDIIRP